MDLRALTLIDTFSVVVLPVPWQSVRQREERVGGDGGLRPWL